MKFLGFIALSSVLFYIDSAESVRGFRTSGLRNPYVSSESGTLSSSFSLGGGTSGGGGIRGAAGGDSDSGGSLTIAGGGKGDDDGGLAIKPRLGSSVKADIEAAAKDFLDAITAEIKKTIEAASESKNGGATFSSSNADGNFKLYFNSNSETKSGDLKTNTITCSSGEGVGNQDDLTFNSGFGSSDSSEDFFTLGRKKTKGSLGAKSTAESKPSLGFALASGSKGDPTTDSGSSGSLGIRSEDKVSGFADTEDDVETGVLSAGGNSEGGAGGLTFSAREDSKRNSLSATTSSRFDSESEDSGRGSSGFSLGAKSKVGGDSEGKSRGKGGYSISSRSKSESDSETKSGTGFGLSINSKSKTELESESESEGGAAFSVSSRSKGDGDNDGEIGSRAKTDADSESSSKGSGGFSLKARSSIGSESESSGSGGASFSASGKSSGDSSGDGGASLSLGGASAKFGFRRSRPSQRVEYAIPDERPRRGFRQRPTQRRRPSETAVYVYDP